MKQLNERLEFKGMHETSVAGLVTVVIFLASFSQSLLAQNPSSNDVSGKTGVVTGDEVRLRGGPGTNYKEVGRVGEGTQLQVTRKQGEWFEVVPPEQARVWVYGEYVEQIDSTTGKVTGTDVNVRPLPQEQTNMPVGQISKPAKVKIVDTNQTEGYDQPWYQIQMPKELKPWVHSRFVNVGSDGNGQDETPDEAEQEQEAAESEQAQKGGGASQKGGTPQKGEGKGAALDGENFDVQGASDKWQDRLMSIQDEVEKERSKEDKLRWDFSDQIQQLDTYIQKCPNDQLVGIAEDIRSELKNVQSNVQKQRQRLNKRLREIREERKEAVRNSIQDVLAAKGFSWDVTGYVKSVGGLYSRPPAEYELVKGKRRIYFLKSGRDILKLKNYRGLQVAISGNEQPVQDDNWDAPLMEVQKIEVIR